MDCLFCKIISGEIPSKKLYEDELVYAFYDIEPQSPVHFLVIPKEHIAGADDITVEKGPLVGHVFAVIANLAKELNLSGGYRIVNNCGKDAQQSVRHLHFHVLAGRELAWPPG